MVKVVQRSRWVKYQTAFTPQRTNQLQGSINMRRCFRVKSNISGASGGKVLYQPIDRADHQVHIDRCFNAEASKVLAYFGTKSQHGDIVVIHDIEVNNVGTSLKHGTDFLPQASEIG